MTEDEFTSLRTEICCILSRRTPFTEQLELLQLVQRFEPKDRHIARAAFLRYANPERAFDAHEDPEFDTEMATVYAAMGIMFELYQHFEWDIQEHEVPLMEIAFETVSESMAASQSEEAGTPSASSETVEWERQRHELMWEFRRSFEAGEGLEAGHLDELMDDVFDYLPWKQRNAAKSFFVYAWAHFDHLGELAPARGIFPDKAASNARGAVTEDDVMTRAQRILEFAALTRTRVLSDLERGDYSTRPDHWQPLF